MKSARLIVVLLVLAFALSESQAETPAKVDFARDVLPLFNAHCIECHGPQKQNNGFRLDRRRDAMRGGTSRMIGRSSAASRLYLKLVSDQYGPQMPPGAPLADEEIAVVKAWIDEGAVWPDDLAGETPPKPADPEATRLMDLLRDDNRAAVQRMLQEAPGAAKLTGTGGSTPLMYAALYGDVDSMRGVLEAGADPNARNEAGATALMWAVDDLKKTRLLINAGADVNARSADGRTPLLIATGYFDAGEIVKLLLEHGADPSVGAPSYRGPITPARQAADRGDEIVLRMLLERGANLKSAGPFPFVGALNVRSTACLDLLTMRGDVKAFGPALSFIAPPFGDANTLGDLATVKMLVDRGADVNARDRAGHTVLMLAARLDTIPADVVQTLIDRGADVTAKMPDGKTALDFARQRGETPVVDLLIRAGAAGSNEASPAPKPSPARSAREALKRSIPLLQRVDVQFLEKTGCVSCHHNSLTALTVAAARKHGLAVDDSIAAAQLKATASYLENWRERALQGVGIPGESNTVNYILAGMAADRYPPDAATDAMARFLKNQQSPDGRWRLVANRPPLNSSEVEMTAFAMRALQVYAPRPQRDDYEKAVRRAADWLGKVQPKTTTDRVFQLLGLTWAGESNDATQATAKQLLAEQRPDGGWAQLATMESDAYATGQALVALHEGAGLKPGDAAHQRGVQFLLRSQLENGSWHVKSRAIAFQPYFESGFPHGHDQWISAAATNWAAMALVPAPR